MGMKRLEELGAKSIMFTAVVWYKGNRYEKLLRNPFDSVNRIFPFDDPNHDWEEILMYWADTVNGLAVQLGDSVVAPRKCNWCGVVTDRTAYGQCTNCGRLQ